jgi:protein involved in polysaccharide export with SLBB domain
MNTKIFLSTLLLLSLSLAPCGAQVSQVTPLPAGATVLPALAHAPDQIIINVLGQVNRADRITLPAGSGLLDAIAAAGGFTRVANPAKIIIIHKSAGDKPDVSRIDMNKITSGMVKDIKLRDGDTVEVGQAIF